MLDNALIKRLASDPGSQPLKAATGSPGPCEKPWAISPSTAATSPPPASAAATTRLSSGSPWSLGSLSPSPPSQVPGKLSPKSARHGRPMSRQSPRPTSRQGDPRLNDVPEKPQKPDKVMKMQVVAQNRSNDLQNIFTSRHSDRCDRLRTQLCTLTNLSTDLRARIATLERELQEATTERLQLDMHRAGEDSQTSNAKDHEDYDVTAHHSTDEDGGISIRTDMHHTPSSYSATDQLELPPLGGQAADASAADPERQSLAGQSPAHASGSGAVDRTTAWQSVDKRYQDEVLMPLLVRRRAEARYKEASCLHEQAVNQMKSELQSIERRTVKQAAWMRQVDAQVLKNELSKAQYQVRLESARKRVETLGKHLSSAYDTIQVLYEERLDAEDAAVKNEALLTYLHLLGISDVDNAERKIDNKKDLQLLNEHSKRLFSKRSQLEDLLEKVRCTQVLATDIVRHSEELAGLSEQLQQLWGLVPVEWKESVMKSVQKGLASPLSMHPVNAIQALQGASSHVSNSIKTYLRALSEYVDGTHALANRRSGLKGGHGNLSQMASDSRRSKPFRGGPGDISIVTEHLSAKARATYEDRNAWRECGEEEPEPTRPSSHDDVILAPKMETTEASKFWQ